MLADSCWLLPVKNSYIRVIWRQKILEAYYHHFFSRDIDGTFDIQLFALYILQMLLIITLLKIGISLR